MQNLDITVTLYGESYKENSLVRSILAKNFGFELILESDYERNRRILNLEQIQNLKKSIDKALEEYNLNINNI
jgi:hypothetical protein